MLEQNDKKQNVEEASQDVSLAAGEELDADNRLSQEFSATLNFSKVIGSTQAAQNESKLQSKEESETEFQRNQDATASAGETLRQEMLSSLFTGPSFRRTDRTGNQAPELTIVDTANATESDQNSTPDGGAETTSLDQNSIKQVRGYKINVKSNILDRARATASHVPSPEMFGDAGAKSVINKFQFNDAVPQPVHAGGDIPTTQTQQHVLITDKPESFRDFEATTGGDRRPTSNIVSAPLNVDAYPANPPAITIHRPGQESEKPQTIGSNRPEAAQQFPGVKFPGSETFPTDKTPPGALNDIFSKPNDLRGPRNDQVSDSGLITPSSTQVGLPFLPDSSKIQDSGFHTSITLAPISIGQLGALPAASQLKPIETRNDGAELTQHAVARPAVGLPIYASADLTSAPYSGGHRELPTATPRTEYQSNISRYSSQEWASSIPSQTRGKEAEAKAPAVTEQQPDKAINIGIEKSDSKIGSQNVLSKDLAKATQEKTEGQAQIEAFRARHEQAIPSQSFRNQQVIAYSALPPGTSEKVFAGKSFSASGESQLMRNSSAAKAVGLQMPQPFKLNSSDKALFVTPTTKTQVLETTVKGMQRESASLAAITKAELAAKRALSIDQSLAIGAKNSDVQANKSTQRLAAVPTKGETVITSNMHQQPRSVSKSVESQVKVDTQKRAETIQSRIDSQVKQEQVKQSIQGRLDAQSRLEAQLKIDTKSRVDSQTRSETQIKSAPKFVQSKAEQTSSIVKLEQEVNAYTFNLKLDRGFGNKASFTGTVSSDSSAIIMNTRKSEAGEAGCGKKGDSKRFLPGAELALAAVVALSGARKRRTGEEQNSAGFNADSEQMAKQVLHRRTYMVEQDDTLQSIAERIYGIREAAGLIADLNALSVGDQSIDGRRVVELKVRQTLELPEPEEVRAYLGGLPKNYDVEQIVTIVIENNVDVELLRDFLGRVCDDKATQKPAVATVAAQAPLPAKSELPELVIEDEKLPPPSAGLGAVVTDLATLISRGFKRPTTDLGALS
jgi:hypothetical protein